MLINNLIVLLLLVACCVDVANGQFWSWVFGGGNGNSADTSQPAQQSSSAASSSSSNSGGGWLSGLFGSSDSSSSNQQQSSQPANDGWNSDIFSGFGSGSSNSNSNTGGSTMTGVGQPCNGVSGVCQDITRQTCSSARLTGKCPGSSQVKCCPSSSSSGSSNTGSSNTGSSNTGSSNTGSSNTGSSNTGSSSSWLGRLFGNSGSSNTGSSNTGSSNTGSNSGSSTPVVMSNKVGVGSSCSGGVSGVCQDIELQSCSRTRLRGKCPGPSTVMCCPSSSSSVGSSSGSNSGGNNDVPVSSGAGGCGRYAGLAFPLVSGSLREISVNWGGSRSGGKRCHAGLDIYTSGARRVQAMSSGVVTAILTGWYKCSGGSIDAIFVYHDSGPLRGQTINYGEIDPGTYSVRVGSQVSRGQQLGVASRCGMLHIEFYSGRRTRNSHWYPVTTVGSGCTRNSMRKKPAELLDPRPPIRCTMPSNARFRGGVGFLQAGDQDEIAADLDEIGDETTVSTGLIVGLVVGLLVLCVLVVAVVLYVNGMRRGAAPVESGVGFTNAAYSVQYESARPDMTYSQTGGAGTFACNVCGKTYDYADDLTTHVSLRHP